MIRSYQFSSSDFTWVSVQLAVSKLSRIRFVSLMGMLEYMFVLSREANLLVGVMGVCCRS